MITLLIISLFSPVGLVLMRFELACCFMSDGSTLSVIVSMALFCIKLLLLLLLVLLWVLLNQIKIIAPKGVTTKGIIVGVTTTAITSVRTTTPP